MKKLSELLNGTCLVFGPQQTISRTHSIGRWRSRVSSAIQLSLSIRCSVDRARRISGCRPRRYLRDSYSTSVPSGSVCITLITNAEVKPHDWRRLLNGRRAYSGLAPVGRVVRMWARRKPPGWASSEAVPISGWSRSRLGSERSSAVAAVQMLSEGIITRWRSRTHSLVWLQSRESAPGEGGLREKGGMGGKSRAVLRSQREAPD
mmetsp:Transcript_41710/g.103637  ORF Transcript_41710/g.103637 Transcript_41710/m.103637 type:complete len:205 (+) Transcript_41710:441-1055(+)